MESSLNFAEKVNAKNYIGLDGALIDTINSGNQFPKNYLSIIASERAFTLVRMASEDGNFNNSNWDELYLRDIWNNIIIFFDNNEDWFNFYENLA